MTHIGLSPDNGLRGSVDKAEISLENYHGKQMIVNIPEICCSPILHFKQ